MSDWILPGDEFADRVDLLDNPPADNGAAPSSAAAPIVIETLRDFLARPLPKAESLIGTVRDGTNLLPRYGWVMPWGREGCGKTSILVDLLFHAAAGLNWLHYPVSRPLRVVVVINEGVPGGLQDKLEQKLARWPGPTEAILDNLALYVSPWGEFNFQNERAAQHMRAYSLDFQADYVTLDPLHTMGTSGAGTPQETEAFKHVLRQFGLWQDLGFITAHHSNKGGMVSGDWARHPDTVLRLEKDGKQPATKLTLEKARPADPLELGVPQLLEWVTATLGYHCVPLATTSVSDDELLQRIRDKLAKSSEPLTMTALLETVEGDDGRKRNLVKSQIAAGQIVNTASRKGHFRLQNAVPGAGSGTGSTDYSDDAAQTRMASSVAPGDPPSPGEEGRGEGWEYPVPQRAPVRGTGYYLTDSTPETGPPEPDGWIEPAASEDTNG